MINNIKNWIVFWISWALTMIFIWITYAATVSSWQLLTADLFNEKMVPTWAVMAFNWDRCPNWWTKANWDWVEKDVDWNLTTLDLRWEFIRWWDDWRWVDSSRWLASWQSDSFKSHSHTYNYLAWVSYNSWIDFDAANDINGWVWQNKSTSAVWWSETRPRNVALLYCVKN